MAQQRRDDAGNSGMPFYEVILQPGDWYNWFQSSKIKPDVHQSGGAGSGSKQDDDSGWTQVSVLTLYSCCNFHVMYDIYSNLL